MQDFRNGLNEEIKSLLNKGKHEEATALKKVSKAIDSALEKEVERLEHARREKVREELKEKIKERKRKGVDGFCLKTKQNFNWRTEGGHEMLEVVFKCDQCDMYAGDDIMTFGRYNMHFIEEKFKKFHTIKRVE